MSDNFDHTAYAHQPAALSENPFNWDWDTMKKEVDDSFAGDPVGVFHDITLASLEEESSIPGWWMVQDAPSEGSQDAARPVSQKKRHTLRKGPQTDLFCVISCVS